MCCSRLAEQQHFNWCSGCLVRSSYLVVGGIAANAANSQTSRLITKKDKHGCANQFSLFLLYGEWPMAPLVSFKRKVTNQTGTQPLAGGSNYVVEIIRNGCLMASRVP